MIIGSSPLLPELPPNPRVNPGQALVPVQRELERREPPKQVPAPRQADEATRSRARAQFEAGQSAYRSAPAAELSPQARRAISAYQQTATVVQRAELTELLGVDLYA